MTILVTIPTLGERKNSLVLTIASLLEFMPQASIELRCPNLEQITFISKIFNSPRLVLVQDSSDQSRSILNSWSQNRFDWYTWINDDDFALAGVKQLVEKSDAYLHLSMPVVIFGDLGFMDNMTTRTIKTPHFINTWLLSRGRNYIPGLLTLVNLEASEKLVKNFNEHQLMRNSFDYQWWLYLSTNQTLFIHSNSTCAIWRFHEGARTQVESEFSMRETSLLRFQYGFKLIKYRYIWRIPNLFARAIVKAQVMVRRCRVL